MCHFFKEALIPVSLFNVVVLSEVLEGMYSEWSTGTCNHYCTVSQASNCGTVVVTAVICGCQAVKCAIFRGM
jgi:hypothetical protein